MVSLWIFSFLCIAAVYSLPVPENTLVQVPEYVSFEAANPVDIVEVFRIRRSPEALADPDPRHHHRRYGGHGGGYGGYGGHGGYGGYPGGYGGHRPGYGGGYGGYPGGGGGGFSNSNAQSSANSFSGGFSSPFGGGASFSGSSAQSSANSGSNGFYGR